VLHGERGCLNERICRSLNRPVGELLPAAPATTFSLRLSPERYDTHRVGELLDGTDRNNEPVDARIDKIIGGPHLVGRDHGDAVCEGLVHHQAPDLIPRRDDQRSGLRVKLVEGLFLYVAKQADTRIARSGRLDLRSNRAVAHDPELAVLELGECTQQKVNAFRSIRRPTKR
jgi:hypothetical protein